MVAIGGKWDLEKHLKRKWLKICCYLAWGNRGKMKKKFQRNWWKMEKFQSNWWKMEKKFQRKWRKEEEKLEREMARKKDEYIMREVSTFMIAKRQMEENFVAEMKKTEVEIENEKKLTLQRFKRKRLKFCRDLEGLEWKESFKRHNLEVDFKLCVCFHRELIESVKNLQEKVENMTPPEKNGLESFGLVYSTVST